MRNYWGDQPSKITAEQQAQMERFIDLIENHPHRAISVTTHFGDTTIECWVCGEAWPWPLEQV